MKQSEVFQTGEGDAWLERNRGNLYLCGTAGNAIDKLIQKHIVIPKFVYEVGCSNGWLLHELKGLFGCKTGGIDPSRDAINQAKLYDQSANVYYGSARRLHGAEGCDVLIYGFCLYLCDPEDYFEIVMEGDRVLKDGGYLIIHDFDSNGYPFRVPYEHKEGIWSHHVAFEELWAAHPWYEILEQQHRDGELFTIMKKDSATAFGRKK